MYSLKDSFQETFLYSRGQYLKKKQPITNSSKNRNILVLLYRDAAVFHEIVFPRVTIRSSCSISQPIDPLYPKAKLSEDTTPIAISLPGNLLARGRARVSGQEQRHGGGLMSNDWLGRRGRRFVHTELIPNNVSRAARHAIVGNKTAGSTVFCRRSAPLFIPQPRIFLWGVRRALWPVRQRITDFQSKGTKALFLSVKPSDR